MEGLVNAGTLLADSAGRSAGGETSRRVRGLAFFLLYCHPFINKDWWDERQESLPEGRWLERNAVQVVIEQVDFRGRGRISLADGRDR
jgi:hypothetical protein